MLRKGLNLLLPLLIFSTVAIGFDCRSRELERVEAARLAAYFTANLKQFGDTEDQVIVRLGPPIGLKRTESPSRHNPGAHHLLSTLTYKVLKFHTVRFDENSPAQVYALIYTGGTLADPLIAIGAPKNRVEALLGPPLSAGEKYPSVMRYETENRDVFFTIAEGNVSVIDFTTYIE